jgi:hypothetical protein
MDHTIFCLQAASYSLLTASMVVTFADEIRSAMKNANLAIRKSWSGSAKQTFRLRSFANSCVRFAVTCVSGGASISKWIGRRRGATTMASLYTILGCTVVMLLASLAIPVERASVVNQVKTTGIICLPHVTEDLDAYHWIMEPDCNPALRTATTFCADRGFKPPFQEGQKLKYLRYRRWDECLELLGGDCFRENDNDPKSSCIRR